MKRNLIIGTLVWIVYLVLSVEMPHQANPYHIGHIQMILLQATIFLPVLAIWLVALYGATRLSGYVRAIKSSPDGQALGIMATGLWVLVGLSILQSLLGALPDYAVGTSWLLPLVFINNQLPVVAALLGFGLFFIGSRRLTRITGRPQSLERMLGWIVPYVVLGGIFGWFYYHDLNHVVINGVPNTAMPGKLSFYSLAIPFIISWLLGVASIVNIADYTRQVKGVIYRSALHNFARGLAVVLFFSILVQILTLSATFLGHLQLAPLLMLIYALLILYAVGFVLIARGVRLLLRIEQVGP